MSLGPYEPCPCRKLSEGLYGVAKGCTRHDDGKGRTHFSCVCWYTTEGPKKEPMPVKNLVCLVCDENVRRGGKRANG